MKKASRVLYLMSMIMCIANAKNDSTTNSTEYTSIGARKALYAPWREQYTQKDKSPTPVKTTSCPFCNQIQENNDDTHFIIRRYKYVLVCMNKFPYNAGHLLVIPFEHQSDFSQLPPEVAYELMTVTQNAIAALKEVCNPDAFNIGINMGLEKKLDKAQIAGGSLPGHIHIHILPRSVCDAGFLAVLDNTSLIPTDIPNLYQKLKEALK